MLSTVAKFPFVAAPSIASPPRIMCYGIAAIPTIGVPGVTGVVEKMAVASIAKKERKCIA